MITMMGLVQYMSIRQAIVTKEKRLQRTTKIDRPAMKRRLYLYSMLFAIGTASGSKKRILCIGISFG